jgi:hypothetical protein
LEIDLITEEYKHAEFLNVYEILKEQASYPAEIQKTLFNYAATGNL